MGQTRPLFLNPFAGIVHTQLQLENCTFYGCHKQRRLCATLTFTFRFTTLQRRRRRGSLPDSKRFIFFFEIFCFLPLVIVFGAARKPNSNPKPFSQLQCAVGVCPESSTSTAGEEACSAGRCLFPILKNRK